MEPLFPKVKRGSRGFAFDALNSAAPSQDGKRADT